MGSNEEYLNDLLSALNQQEADGDVSMETNPVNDPDEEAGVDLSAVDEETSIFDAKPSSDEIKDMSEDEILQLLQFSSMESEPEEPAVNVETETINEDDELDALLRGMEQEDANLAEINDLLFKSEQNQPIEQDEEETTQPEADFLQPEAILEEDMGEMEDKKSSKKMKKEKASKDKKEKKGLFAKKKKEEEAEEQADSEEMPLDDTIFAEDSVFAEPIEEDEENPEELKPVEESTAEPELSFTDDSQTAESMSDIFSENPEEQPLFMDIDQLVEEASGLIPEKDAVAPEQTEESEPAKEKEKKKKPAFIAKLLDFLFEEDENPEEGGENGEDVEALGVTSDENQEVLKQLKKEDKEGKKKKKKKGKGKDVAPENAEEDDENEESADSKKKEKKPKKQKKEKPPKPEPDSDTPEPKLSKKKVRATGFFAFTILAALLICCLLIPGLIQLADARGAYYDGDYETCFRGLYGKKLSDSDQLMFERAQLMLSMNRNQEAYRNFVAVGDEMRALDALLQAVDKQENILTEAQKYELTAQADAAYQEILTILAEKYQLSEADAKEINGYEQDVVYTLRVKSVVEGTPFELPAFLSGNPGSDEEAEADADKPMVDVLAAEEEMTDTAYEEGIQEP